MYEFNGHKIITRQYVMKAVNISFGFLRFFSSVGNM